MIAPTTPFYQPNPQDHIPVLLDTEDPEQLWLMHVLRAYFKQFSDIEGVDGRFFLVRLYPGLAMELLR